MSEEVKVNVGNIEYAPDYNSTDKRLVDKTLKMEDCELPLEQIEKIKALSAEADRRKARIYIDEALDKERKRIAAILRPCCQRMQPRTGNPKIGLEQCLEDISIASQTFTRGIKNAVETEREAILEILNLEEQRLRHLANSYVADKKNVTQEDDTFFADYHAKADIVRALAKIIKARSE